MILSMKAFYRKPFFKIAKPCSISSSVVEAKPNLMALMLYVLPSPMSKPILPTFSLKIGKNTEGSNFAQTAKPPLGFWKSKVYFCPIISKKDKKNMTVQFAQTPEEIAKCWEAMHALRPHLEKDTFVALVQEMQMTGYHLAFVEKDGKAAAAVGYRYLHFLFCDKHIYIDDLTTLPEYRGHGF